MTRFSEHYQIPQKGGRARFFKRLSLRSVLFVMLIGLAASYVAQTTAVSVKGYDMSDLQNKMSLLKRDTQAIDVQIAAYRSMDSIQKRLPSLNLVAAADVSYVSPVGTAVARR